MIVPVSDDQAVFVETAARFLDDTCSPELVRAAADEPAGFRRTWWAQAADLGWTSPLVPDELGGGSPSGQGLLELVHVAEQLGRHVAPGPFITTSAALVGLEGAVGHAETIAAVLTGDAVLTWCDGTGLTAERRAGEIVLSGTANHVEAGADADLFLVPTAGTSLLVAADTPGVRVERTDSIDLTRRLATVSFTEVRVAESDVVETGSVDRQAWTGAVLQSAEAVGATERVFEFTLDYVGERFSFGRPLSSYQALKHRFADMKTALEAARGVVAGAAIALQDGDPRAVRIVSAAKAWTGEALPALVQDCVQMHGGIGVTWEHDLHLHLRRVMLARSLYGTPDVHRRRLATSAAA